MDREKLDTVCENFINSTMDFYDIPGIAVGVCVDKTICTVAGGYKNYVTKEPVETDTVFHCTSVSKLFTAVGVMKLAEEGKLCLADRLSDILPFLTIADERWQNITIEAMLTHTSGLTDIFDYHWEEHKIEENALREYAISEEVVDRKLLWDPKERHFRYSSMAYNLLGLVIAEVSGMPFEDYMENEIFKPLGLKDTTFKTFERTNGLAMPHSKGRDRTIRPEEVYPYTRQHAPSSTLTSNVADLLKWATAIMNSTALCRESTEDMWQPRVSVPDTGEKMGLGWFIREQDGYTLMGHEGSDDGFRTSFWMCPELKIAIVLLCNLTDAPLKKLNKQLFDNIQK